MPAALAALLGALITVVACYAAGVLSIDLLGIELKRGERLPLGFVLGAAYLHLAVFAVMVLKIAYPAVLVGLLVAAIGAGWSRGAGPRPALPRLAFLIFAVYGILYFVNAWAPEASPDGAGYHLELVSRYLRVHGFERVTTNMYASLSEGVEMLFLPAFAIGKHSAAALVHFAFATMLALAMFAYGRRIGKPWVGAAGALLTYVSPIVGKTGSSAYIDVAVAAIVFSVFYWLEIWDRLRDARLLIPAGLLAGYAYAAKYTAFVMLIYALGFVAWRARKLRPVLLVAACAAVMAAPWVIKDWIGMQNPVAPFFNQVFRNPNVHISFEQGYTERMRRGAVENKWTLPLEMTVRGERTQGLLGPAFLAAPLAFLALRFRTGRRLLAPGCLLAAVYFGNTMARFLIPCLPFFSLAMALALGNSRVLLGALMLFHAVTCWPGVMSRYVPEYAWRIAGFPYEAALRRMPEDVYLSKNLASYSLSRMVEQNVPLGERVLSLSDFPQAYTSREILVSYQAAFNQTLMDMLSAARGPAWMFVFHLSEGSSRRLRLVQTARVKAQQQWSVNEVRFLNRGVELPRRPEWRLRAFPNPWDVQLAFDNSPATRWRTWETAAPGMYIDVDFGRTETVDEVRMETARESSWTVQVQVESMDSDGRWVKVAEKAEELDVSAPGSTRCAATYELHLKGVNYLLMKDTDNAAEDFRKEPEAWGLRVVANVPGATLYKVVW